VILWNVYRMFVHGNGWFWKGTARLLVGGSRRRELNELQRLRALHIIVVGLLSRGTRSAQHFGWEIAWKGVILKRGLEDSTKTCLMSICIDYIYCNLFRQTYTAIIR